MSRAHRAACALALGALVFPGCGGDDDEDTGKEKGGPLSAAEYRKQGNDLCRDAISKAGEVPPPKSPDGIADYTERVFDVASSYNDDFEALEPPKELRRDHEEAVRLSEETEQETDELVERLRRSENPTAAVGREFRRLLRSPAFKRSLRVTRRLGLEECLEVGQPPQAPQSS